MFGCWDWLVGKERAFLRIENPVRFVGMFKRATGYRLPDFHLILRLLPLEVDVVGLVCM